MGLVGSVACGILIPQPGVDTGSPALQNVFLTTRPLGKPPYSFIYSTPDIWWASLVAQSVKCLPAMQETWVLSLGWEDCPGGGHGNWCQYSCLENPHGQRSLAGYSPWGHKELDMTEQLSTAQHIQSNRRHCIKYNIVWSKQYYELSVIFSIFSREKKMPSRGIN